MQADNVSARGPQEEENPELVCESTCFQLPLCTLFLCLCRPAQWSPGGDPRARL